MRELALAFNKYASRFAETGNGKIAPGSPSPADILEGALFGGALHVEWKQDEDVGGMDCISRIVISGSKLHEDEDGPFFEIGASNLLSTFCHLNPHARSPSQTQSTPMHLWSHLDSELQDLSPSFSHLRQAKTSSSTRSRRDVCE